jgi:hypothetical protein
MAGPEFDKSSKNFSRNPKQSIIQAAEKVSLSRDLRQELETELLEDVAFACKTQSLVRSLWRIFKTDLSINFQLGRIQ